MRSWALTLVRMSRFGHADALHDGEAGGVLVALGELLVVEHQDGGEEEHRAEDKGEEEEAAVGGVELPRAPRGDLTAHLGGEGADDVLRAEIEPRGGAEHDEDHGREDTDDGKSRAGALHTIDERGERDEVFLLVIEPVIALERAAEGNAAAMKRRNVARMTMTTATKKTSIAVIGSVMVTAR